PFGLRVRPSFHNRFLHLGGTRARPAPAAVRGVRSPLPTVTGTGHEPKREAAAPRTGPQEAPPGATAARPGSGQADAQPGPRVVARRRRRGHAPAHLRVVLRVLILREGEAPAEPPIT